MPLLRSSSNVMAPLKPIYVLCKIAVLVIGSETASRKTGNSVAIFRSKELPKISSTWFLPIALLICL
jgi:hypothetical protein